MRICIEDFAGILRGENLAIDDKFLIHTGEFCSEIAKSTAKGHNLCIWCKRRANERAMSTESTFCGCCVFGVREAVCPVVLEGKTICVVYCGGYVTDYSKSLEKLRSTCRKADIDYEKAKTYFTEHNVKADSDAYYIKTAEFISDYIAKLFSEEQSPQGITPVQYVVNSMEIDYSSNLSITGYAERLYINPKHLGRLFKSQMGTSFNQYLEGIRMQKSRELLLTTKWNVIDIAYAVGFNNVTYFNRVFKATFGITPKQMRLTGKE